MLKLTRSHSPYSTDTLWIAQQHITAMERNDDATVVYTVGPNIHFVTESPEEILAMMAPVRNFEPGGMTYYDPRNPMVR